MGCRFVAVTACLLLACAPAGAPTAQREASAVAGAADTSWVSRSALYEVFVRDFSPSGDFRGVIDGLDRIAASGADVVWLMPIHPIGVAGRKGTLGSPYSVRDYYAINPSFGTASDFRELVTAIHARGMKLILDWVPNHTALDAAWANEHPAFHVRDEQGRLTVPRDDKGKLTDWTDVAQLDYRNAAMQQAMIAAMRHWLVEFNIDGFRMDVAGFVPDQFWLAAIPVLRGAVPRSILLLAEWGDLKMHRLGFDLTYGWDGYSRLKAVWSGGSAASFVEAELAELRVMPAGGMRIRFTTNHDETAWDNPPGTIFGGVAGARAAFVAMALLPGRPLLYNGQEVESEVRLRLFERDSIDWGVAGAADAGAFYRRVMQLAHTHPSFSGQGLIAVATSAPNDVIAYRRGDALVLVNARPRSTRFTVHGDAVAGARDLLADQIHRTESVTLPPYGAVVLERSPR